LKISRHHYDPFLALQVDLVNLSIAVMEVSVLKDLGDFPRWTMPATKKLLVFSNKSNKAPSLAIVAPAGGPCQSGNSCDGGVCAEGLRGQLAAPGLCGKCHWRATATSSGYVICKRYDHKADVQYSMAQLSVPCSELSRRTRHYCRCPGAIRHRACGFVCGTWCFA